LSPLHRFDGRILQFVERDPLRRRGLDRLADAVDRQVGDARRLLMLLAAAVFSAAKSGPTARATPLPKLL
jgi:hypothetical protein